LVRAIRHRRWESPWLGQPFRAAGRPRLPPAATDPGRRLDDIRGSRGRPRNAGQPVSTGAIAWGWLPSAGSRRLVGRTRARPPGPCGAAAPALHGGARASRDATPERAWPRTVRLLPWVPGGLSHSLPSALPACHPDGRRPRPEGRGRRSPRRLPHRGSGRGCHRAPPETFVVFESSAPANSHLPGDRRRPDARERWAGCVYRDASDAPRVVALSGGHDRRVLPRQPRAPQARHRRRRRRHVPRHLAPVAGGRGG
jgi:hypothetical protein